MAANNRPTDYERAKEQQLQTARRHNALLRAMHETSKKLRGVYTALNAIDREEQAVQSHVQIELYERVNRNYQHQYRPVDEERQRQNQARKRP